MVLQKDEANSVEQEQTKSIVYWCMLKTVISSLTG